MEEVKEFSAAVIGKGFEDPIHLAFPYMQPKHCILKAFSLCEEAVQVIFQFTGDPESYIAGGCHAKVMPPAVCPHCGLADCLEPHGYYPRGITAAASAGILSLQIRRFLCWATGRTVSMLPDFAQPYRLVRNSAVQKFFSGECAGMDVIRWTPLLKRYWRRFQSWFPVLFEKTADHTGPDPPMPEHIWRYFVSAWGEMPGATIHLVGVFRITAFGRYRCHQVPKGATAQE